MADEESKKFVCNPGQPTKFIEGETEVAAQYYVDNYETIDEGKFPTFAGLARYLGVSKMTLSEWKNRSISEQFSSSYEALKLEQEIRVLHGGMTEGFNSNIAKLVLFNHGYSDKTETTVKGSLVATEMTAEERQQRIKELEIERARSEEV